MAEIKNPQQEPGGERKLLLIFALTFIMIVIGQTVFFKNLPKKQKQVLEDAKDELRKVFGRAD